MCQINLACLFLGQGDGIKEERLPRTMKNQSGTNSCEGNVIRGSEAAQYKLLTLWLTNSEQKASHGKHKGNQGMHFPRDSHTEIHEV
jgi:hypothetical protein